MTDDDPTSRALALLTALQSRPTWVAVELARRLGVSARTLRRDVDRLRRLGYTVETRPGPGATHRLLPGVAVPPLLLDADEITAVVAGLRLVAPRLVDDTAARSALAKLDRVLPRALHEQADAVDLATELLEPTEAGVDVGTVRRIAVAVAGEGRLRFGYRDQAGRTSSRTVAPYRLVLRGGRSYLVAFDVDRADWRLFRVDRMADVTTVRGTYRRPEFPAVSIAAWFASDFGRA